MAERTGWHCTACNRYFQRPADEPPPSACPYCGDPGSLRRIEHDRDEPRAPEFEVGDVVGARRIGEVEEYVVGEVVTISRDRVYLDAIDGTGRYAVAPDEIEHVRRRT